MKKKLFLLVPVALLSACNLLEVIKPSKEEPKKTQLSVSSVSAVQPSSDIDFNNDSPDPKFDSHLSNAMHRYDKITVALASRVDPDEGEMPYQLNKWVTAVKESGGEIDYEPETDDMSAMLVVGLISVALKGYELGSAWYKEYQEEQSRYKIAEKYDARYCYRKDDNMVTKIVFIERDNRDSEKAFCNK